MCDVIGALFGLFVTLWFHLLFRTDSVPSSVAMCVCCHHNLFTFFELRRARTVFVPISLPYLLFRDWSCSVQGWKGCAICVILVPLGAQLVSAIEARGLAPIGRSTVR